MWRGTDLTPPRPTPIHKLSVNMVWKVRFSAPGSCVSLPSPLPGADPAGRPSLLSCSPPPDSSPGKKRPMSGLRLELISSAHLEAGCRLAEDSGGRGLNLLSWAAMRHTAGPGVRGTERQNICSMIWWRWICQQRCALLGQQSLFALMLSWQRKHLSPFEVYRYANLVHHHPLSGASPSSFWLTNHVRGSSLAAVDAVSCDVGWGQGMCRCVILQQVWTPRGQVTWVWKDTKRFCWRNSESPDSRGTRPELLFHFGSHPLLKATYSDLTHFKRTSVDCIN